MKGETHSDFFARPERRTTMKSVPVFWISSALLWLCLFSGSIGCARSRYAITMDDPSDSDYKAMKEKVGKLEQEALKQVPFTYRDERKLRRGKVLSKSYPRTDGLVVERTMGCVELSLERFLAVIPAERWGVNLVDYLGGEVRRHSEGRQVERMVLWAPLTNLDMTKLESVEKEKGPDGKLRAATVSWEVRKSDNGSVETDIGLVRFERHGLRRTRITFLSAHRLKIFPFDCRFVPHCIREKLLAQQLESYFTRAVKHYRTVVLKNRGR